ncbi:MAG: hypothetical protein VB122_08110 [Erysipelotrichales bacterium]|jgi:energy-coupling factor transporter ATP-binding protein EcfA2|nr:hypothetical protein [Erysipelotrichales bacterium]
MERFILKEMLLISLTERKARRISFHPQTTVIIGENDTGKSSLVKSIYAAFGADSAIRHPKWIKAKVYILVRFSLDSIEYSILRVGEAFYLFDNKNNLIGIFDNVQELSEFYVDFFNFKIKLMDHENVLVTPPSQYLFLPYYIDQDISWKRNWSAFSKLNEIPNWRNAIVEYHTGLKPNEYYDIKGQRDLLNNQFKILHQEYDALKNIIGKSREKLGDGEFNLDKSDFQKDIEELVATCNKLKQTEEKYKANILKYNNKKVAIEDQILIIENTIKELEEDYKFAAENIKTDDVECPTCGAHYENSFIERFNLIRDKDRCYLTLNRLKEEYKIVERKIASIKKSFEANNKEIKGLESILLKRQGNINLKDIIASEGKKEFRNIIKVNLSEKQIEIRQMELEIQSLERQMSMFLNKDHREKIINYYRTVMNEFIDKLKVTNLSESMYKKIDTYIYETGSDLPRAQLAYFYSILYVIKRLSSSIFFPVVIDSPNQQEQDPVNHKRIVEFIKEYQPKSSQLILSLVNTAGVKFDGELVKLEDKNSLLLEEQFNNVYEEMEPLINKGLLV